jgi:predicted transcriptional regulator
VVTSRDAGEAILQRDTVSVPLQRKPLPAREAQIAAIVYKLGEASANQVCAALDGELTNAAVRSMLQRLIAKQIVRRRLKGHCYYYAPAEERQPDPREALRKVVDDHFGGCFARARAELERLNR